MVLSIVPNANSRVSRDPGSAPSLTGDASYGGEIFYNQNSANGQYEVPFQVWGTGINLTYMELYRAPPNAGGGAGDVPNHLYLFYRAAGNVETVIDLGDSAALYGKWIHFAWVQTAADTASFYAAVAGYNQSSPTYLISPSLGGIMNASDRIQAGAEKADGGTVSLTTSLARVWATEAALTESQISGPGGVWTQYAPTAAMSAQDYLFLACDDQADPGKDTGNPGTDWAVTGTWSAGQASWPSEWLAGSNGLFMGNPTLLF